MTPAYKTDERALKSIIMNNVKSKSPNLKFDLVKFYKNKKTSSMVMKNSIGNETSKFGRANLVYRYSCPKEDCKLLNNVSYIGMTTTTLSRRLSSHLSNGAPKKHTQEAHRIALTSFMLESSTDLYKLCSLLLTFSGIFI